MHFSRFKAAAFGRSGRPALRRILSSFGAGVLMVSGGIRSAGAASAEDFSGGTSETEGGKESANRMVYASAAEAHVRFLDALESTKGFPSAAACATCHPDHYREWSVSPHAYAQISPVFNTMHAAIMEKTNGTNGEFCIRCHTPVGMDREEKLFTSNLKRNPIATEGITCAVCHRVDGNFGKVSGRRAITKGSLYDPVRGPNGNAFLKSLLETDSKLKSSEDGPGEMKIHSDAIKFDPITTAGFCGTCHDVNLPNGFRLEEAFSQFKNSPAAKAGQSCQDCHMGRVPGAVTGEGDANFHRGPAARIGGAAWAEKGDPDYGEPTPVRKRTNHMFIGPDYSIVHPGIFPQSGKIRARLWDWQRQTVASGSVTVEERAGLEHIIAFKWEEGWGDASSAFEKRVEADPGIEKNLPWPWNDYGYRMEFRLLLNDQFRLLNEADAQRHQVLRRGYRLGDFRVTRDDDRALEFQVQAVNGTDGHAVPTGFDAERLVFLEVTVRDAQGRVIFESGDRDPNGDVRDLHSTFVHHHAKKEGSWLAASDWKNPLGMERSKEDRFWEPDGSLFSLQSKFLTSNIRGGEREQVLSVNYSQDPLPYVRPETRPSGLVARPVGVRKHAMVLPPGEARWAKYKVDKKALTGSRPYTVTVRFIAQMVPVNLINEISSVGFDYNLSAREVAKRVVHGHRVSGSTRDEDRRGGAQILWDRALVLDGSRSDWDLRPTEAEIMAPVAPQFPYKPDLETSDEIPSAGVITFRTFEKLPHERSAKPGGEMKDDPPAQTLFPGRPSP